MADDPASVVHSRLDPVYTRAYAAFFAAHESFWRAETAAQSLLPVELQVAEMGALLRVATALAVDAGMALAPFLAACAESHADAYRAAPKWG
jgi:hypothetical protein